MGIGILYVEDHEVFHDCMRHLFESEDDIGVLGTANNGRSAVRLARELTPELVIMDIMMPGMNGIEATRQIVSENPAVKVIGLSALSDSKKILEMFRAGAKGYVVKDSAFEELLQAIQTVARGKMYLSPNITGVVLEDFLNLFEAGQSVGLDLLTPREQEVLQLVAEGKSTKQVATELNLGLKTVETHRANIMKKLKVGSIAEMVKFALREGLTSL